MIGGVLRLQLERLAAGQDPAQLRDLKDAVNALTFIPVVERVQEGDHSIVHRHGGLRRVSGAYVSLIQRFSEIEAMLKEGSLTDSFVECFGLTKNSSKWPSSFVLRTTLFGVRLSVAVQHGRWRHQLLFV